VRSPTTALMSLRSFTTSSAPSDESSRAPSTDYFLALRPLETGDHLVYLRVNKPPAGGRVKLPPLLPL
jgi:hypothetical protein